MDQSALEIKLGHSFFDKTLLEAVLDHPTFLHEHRQRHGHFPDRKPWPPNDDGQYAFVGDAVLATLARAREWGAPRFSPGTPR